MCQEKKKDPYGDKKKLQGDVTRVLERYVAGDPGAVDELLPMIYDELRRLASGYLKRERADHTLNATGLVHEAYMRLIGSELKGAKVESRAHFMVVSARAMRRVLVEHARRYQALRRASPKDRIPLDEDSWPQAARPPEEILVLDQALARLREVNPRQADVVEMRYFGGLSESEIARVLEVSRGTVARDWRIARLLLVRTISGTDDSDSG